MDNEHKNEFGEPVQNDQVNGSDYGFENNDSNVNNDNCSNNSYGNSNDSYGSSNNGYGNSNDSYGSSNNSQGNSNDSYGSSNNSQGNSNDSYGSSNNSQGNSNDSYGSSNNGYGYSNDSYGSSNNGYGYNNAGYGNGNNMYGNGNNNYGNNHNRNGRKTPKIVAIVCGAVAVLIMTAVLATLMTNVLAGVDKKVDENEIAWNDSDSGSDNKDKNSSDDAVATTEPVTVNQGTSQATAVNDVSGIVDSVMPSVVSIISTTSVKGYSFFGQQYEQEVNASGTGFIVGKNDKELLLATNNHVVENSTAIQITFNDETTAEAVIKGTDADADLAVVAVKLSDISDDTLGKIKVAVLGDSDEVKVGQMAVAIGNAKGMGQSVTVGYISAKDRELEIADESTGKTMKMKYLQTDAAINGGNSGGPLLDVSGRVVGINSAKISDTQIEGMCYAIPISTAIPIINELMNRETLTAEEKGYMGVSLSDVSSEAVEKYGVPSGAYVTEVMKGSPAEKAGIKQGDIITKINDTEVASSSAATSKVGSCRAGSEITLTVYRQSASGKGYDEQQIKVTLATAEEAGINSDSNSSSDNSKRQDEDSNEGNGDSGSNGFGNGFDDFFNW